MLVSKVRRKAFVVMGRSVEPGTEEAMEMPIARMPTQGELTLPVMVMHGRRPGPSLWLSAALHGDELNGIEVIRRLRAAVRPRDLAGTILAVPIVNVFGFLEQRRELPDGRDLNRSFPGSPRGSLASRLAHLFLTEIVARCDYGLDFHTATRHRTNLPQLRLDLDNPEARRVGRAFGAPVLLHARTRDGSLRAVASERGATALVFEGGEALRFDEDAIAMATKGGLRVMAALGMIDEAQPPAEEPVECRRSRWVRARRGGLFRPTVSLGQRIENKEALGTLIGGPGEKPRTLKAPFAGIVISLVKNPLVYQGDALVHLARLESS